MVGFTYADLGLCGLVCGPAYSIHCHFEMTRQCRIKLLTLIAGSRFKMTLLARIPYSRGRALGWTDCVVDIDSSISSTLKAKSLTPSYLSKSKRSLANGTLPIAGFWLPLDPSLVLYDPREKSTSQTTESSPFLALSSSARA